MSIPKITDNQYQDMFQIGITPEMIGVKENGRLTTTINQEARGSMTKATIPPDILNSFRDIAAKNGIEIIIRPDSLVLWVNVDGVCVTRIVSHGMIPIEIDDRRNQINDHPHLME